MATEALCSVFTEAMVTGGEKVCLRLGTRMSQKQALEWKTAGRSASVKAFAPQRLVREGSGHRAEL